LRYHHKTPVKDSRQFAADESLKLSRQLLTIMPLLNRHGGEWGVLSP
jgi:hypothetical protein